MNLDFGIAYIKQDTYGIKVTMSEFRGQIYIHIREYMFDPDEELWFPTKKGYAMTSEGLDNVIELLKKASEELAVYYKPSNQLEFNFEE